MLKDIPFEVYGVQVHHLRRPNMEDIQPRDDITLDRGDVVMLVMLKRSSYLKFSLKMATNFKINIIGGGVIGCIQAIELEN